MFVSVCVCVRFLLYFIYIVFNESNILRDIRIVSVWGFFFLMKSFPLILRKKWK